MITGAPVEDGTGISPLVRQGIGRQGGVAESTIKRMEQDEGFPIARGANIEAVYNTLAEAGIIFLPENGGGVGIRLRKTSGPIGSKRPNASMPPAGPRSSSRK
jgi:hypothetical protein